MHWCKNICWNSPIYKFSHKMNSHGIEGHKNQSCSSVISSKFRSRNFSSSPTETSRKIDADDMHMHRHDVVITLFCAASLQKNKKRTQYYLISGFPVLPHLKHLWPVEEQDWFVKWSPTNTSKNRKSAKVSQWNCPHQIRPLRLWLYSTNFISITLLTPLLKQIWIQIDITRHNDDAVTTEAL